MNTTIIQNNNATGANCGEVSNVKPFESESVSIIGQAAALSKPLFSPSCHAALTRHVVQKNPYSDVKAGYNSISHNPKQFPASVTRLFYSPNLGKRASIRAGIRTTLGELGSGNAPAVLGCESSPAFIGGFQSQNPKEANMAKSSIRASAQSQSVVTANASMTAQTTANAGRLSATTHAPHTIHTIGELSQVLRDFGRCVDVELDGQNAVMHLVFDLCGCPDSMVNNRTGAVQVWADFLRDSQAFLAGIILNQSDRVNHFEVKPERDIAHLYENGCGYAVWFETAGTWAQVTLQVDALHVNPQWLAKYIDALMTDLNDVLSDAMVYVQNRIASTPVIDPVDAAHYQTVNTVNAVNTQEVAL